MISRSVLNSGLALVLALTLAGCTITVRTADPGAVGASPSGVIERFESLRGVYYVGDQVSFRIVTNRTGYVTLTALDPDGSVYTFARNLPVRAGRAEVLDGLSPRLPFIAAPPTGRHVVRAHFTPQRTPERVVFVGRSGPDAWHAAIRLELSGTGFDLDDVGETRFDIRR